VRRRDLILGLGATAAMACPPLAARAQQQPVPLIGFLDSGSPDGMTTYLAAFHQGLGETRYVEGRNVAIEHRWAHGVADRLPALARELVDRKVAVIAATRGPWPTRGAKAATSTIPIVFQTGSDPVLDGLVASLNRPGGNVTGATRLSTDLIPKRLALISELKPKMSAIALLVNPRGPQAAEQQQEMRQATGTRGLDLHIFYAGADAEFEPAFVSIAQSKPDALIVGTSPYFIGRRQQIAALAMRHAIPTIFGEPEAVAAGGLMSYAASLADSFRQVGVYVGRILNGDKPADLPVLQPTRFELVLNLKTAKALGLDVPDRLLAIADEVIE
jgi:putative tryptophan/tyrosine transport system substrate-binding protein